MRKSWRVILLILAAIALLVQAGCSDSSAPTGDTTPPTFEVYLNVVERDSACPSNIIFYIRPFRGNDNETASDDLKIRWDFDNDGQWDTDFDVFQEMDWFQPDPLPSGIWSVKSEVVDQAGNSTVHVEALELYPWVPVPPDIIAGSISVTAGSSFKTEVDTLTVGQPFSFSVMRRDWLKPADQLLGLAWYIDDKLVKETTVLTYLPAQPSCVGTGIVVDAGIAAPGLIELRVVFDSAGDFAETDEGNNVAVKNVVVVE